MTVRNDALRRGKLSNAVAESFFATLKNELVYRHTWTTRRPNSSSPLALAMAVVAGLAVGA